MSYAFISGTIPIGGDVALECGWVNNGTWTYAVCKGDKRSPLGVALLPWEVEAIEKAIAADPRGEWKGKKGLRPGLLPEIGRVVATWSGSELTIAFTEGRHTYQESMPKEAFTQANEIIRADGRRRGMIQPLVGAVAPL